MFMPDALDFVAAAPVLPDGGLRADTLVETAAGWRPAGTLRAGQRLHGWSGGLREVVAVGRHRLPAGAGRRLVHVPGGALGNCAPLWLAGGQTLLLESTVVEEVLDCAAARVSARDLVGLRGIAWQAAPGGAELVVPVLDLDEAVFANTGTLVWAEGASDGDGFHPRLGRAAARALVALADGPNPFALPLSAAA